MAVMSDGGGGTAPKSAKEVRKKQKPKRTAPSARELQRTPQADPRLERMKALADLYSPPRVDRNFDGPTMLNGAALTNPVNRIPPIELSRPTYPIEDVNPMDLLDNLSTMMRLKRNRVRQIPSLPGSTMNNPYMYDGVRF